MSASAIEETSPISPLFSSRFQSGRPRRPLCSFWQDIFLRSLVNGPSGERGTSLQATVGPKSRDLWQILLGKGALFFLSLSPFESRSSQEISGASKFAIILSPPTLCRRLSPRDSRATFFRFFSICAAEPIWLRDCFTLSPGLAASLDGLGS